MPRVDINRLVDLMARLRDSENGCPWDLAQSQESLTKLTLQEIYELFDAIAKKDAANICEELGDILFHLVFYARIAEESGDFSLQDVIDKVAEKMQRRHPHIFAGKVYQNEAQRKADWQRIKAEEKAEKPEPYPDLVAHAGSDRASIWQSIEIQTHLAALGFDWPNAHSVIPKIQEELQELQAEMLKPADHKASQERLAEEYGDVLLAAVNLGRKLRLDPDMALRKANHKFYRRCQKMLDLVGGADVFKHKNSIQQQVLWQQVKADE